MNCIYFHRFYLSRSGCPFVLLPPPRIIIFFVVVLLFQTFYGLENDLLLCQGEVGCMDVLCYEGGGERGRLKGRDER